MPTEILLDHADGAPVPITAVATDGLAAWEEGQPEARRVWRRLALPKPEAGAHVLLPNGDGSLAGVLLLVEPTSLREAGGAPWDFAGLPASLPPGDYAYAADGPLTIPAVASRAALGWALGAYALRRYKAEPAAPEPKPRLVWPVAADRAEVIRLDRAICLARDLITTPAEDMGPEEIEAAAYAVAGRHGALVSVIAGEALLAANWPCVHRVGRASPRAPRLIDLTWAPPGLPADAPLLALVGKGVCFDSGGLDLKSSANMKLMKKDMGGAAVALALADVLMDAGLKARLRLLIPAVDNAVAGNAMRPLDVIRSRAGLTIEIGNTDAEGRLILCDALTEVAAAKPDLIVDLATLTGAARVALGTDVPALFCNDDDTAEALLAGARAVDDPLWRLPLVAAYAKQLDSKVADLSSISESAYGGAITAALFLARFVPEGQRWAHVDLMAWNLAARRGRPEGGEAQALRALSVALLGRYGTLPG